MVLDFKMATMDPTINDTMTRVQLRQIRQKLEEERQMRGSPAESTPRGINDPNIKLQEAILKRQQLLDRLGNERSLREDLLRRPASHHARRNTPFDTPRRAESQPPPQYDSHGPRQIIEHQFKPVRLDPLDNTPRAPPHIIQTSPPIVQASQQAPYLVNVGQQPVNTKGEMMEMMMLQNAQMHQMIMNQMMMQALPKPADNSRSNSRVFDMDDVVSRRRPPSVHHHHYDNQSQHHHQPPPSQPTYTLPPVMSQPPAYPMYQSPRYYPAELEPLRQPRGHYHHGH